MLRGVDRLHTADHYLDLRVSDDTSFGPPSCGEALVVAAFKLLEEYAEMSGMDGLKGDDYATLSELLWWWRNRRGTEFYVSIDGRMRKDINQLVRLLTIAHYMHGTPRAPKRNKT